MKGRLQDWQLVNPSAGQHPTAKIRFNFKIEWLRIVELPFSRIIHLRNPLNEGLPISRSRDCQELPKDIGQILLAYIWDQPEVKLEEKILESGGYDKKAWDLTKPVSSNATIDEQKKNDFHGESQREGLASEEVEKIELKNGVPGYMFVCNSATFDECIRRQLFGSPLNQQSEISWIQPGTPLFLCNLTDHMVHGVFVAETNARINIEPGMQKKKLKRKERKKKERKGMKEKRSTLQKNWLYFG